MYRFRDLLVFSLLTGATLGPVRVDAHPPIEPVARAEPYWVKRQELLNERVANAGKSATLLFIGDSITEGWEKEGKDTWAKYYGARGALNLGMSADQAQHVLWRLDHGNLAGLHPRVAVLMIGTNNVAAAPFNGGTVGMIAESIAAVVQKLKERLPQTRILLLGILPMGVAPNALRGEALQVNQIIQNLADGRNVFYLDFGNRFIGRDGAIPTALMSDDLYLHLSAKGYAIWAEAIESQISALLGDSKQ